MGYRLHPPLTSANHTWVTTKMACNNNAFSDMMTLNNYRDRLIVLKTDLDMIFFKAVKYHARKTYGVCGGTVPFIHFISRY